MENFFFYISGKGKPCSNIRHVFVKAITNHSKLLWNLTVDEKYRKVHNSGDICAEIMPSCTVLVPLKFYKKKNDANKNGQKWLRERKLSSDYRLLYLSFLVFLTVCTGWTLFNTWCLVDPVKSQNSVYSSEETNCFLFSFTPPLR